MEWNQQLLDNHKDQLAILVAALTERHVESLSVVESAKAAPTVLADPLPDDMDFTLQPDRSNVVLDLEATGDEMLANLDIILNGGAVGPLSSEN